jgi:hypothetical protein
MNLSQQMQQHQYGQQQQQWNQVGWNHQQAQAVGGASVGGMPTTPVGIPPQMSMQNPIVGPPATQYGYPPNHMPPVPSTIPQNQQQWGNLLINSFSINQLI